MSIDSLVGRVQTVLGTISPEELGITLPHEHLLLDLSVYFVEPSEAGEKMIAYQPLSQENLWYVRYNIFKNKDNMNLLDEQQAIDESMRFKHAGGSTIVELTSIGLGRDPLGLARISRATGLNVIMGCGYYIEESIPGGVKLTEEAISEDIIRDIVEGVGSTGIRSGMIGELGMSWPLTDGNKRSLRAAARAQKQTGAPINIHIANSPDSPFEIIEVLSKAGADLSHVVMSHIDRTIFVHDVRVELAKTGCYLEYDVFGLEGWYPRRMVVSEANQVKADMPNDAARINEIMALIDEGFLNQILISHDHCFKTRLCAYGGPGYAHILNNVVPLMKEKGMSTDAIDTLLVQNPKRLLQFV
jgi:phosphotriesterase-related protein